MRSGPGWHRRGGGRPGDAGRAPLAARVGIATGLVVVGDLDRRGRGPGGGRRRRDPEPRRAAAGPGAARAGGRRRGTRRLIGGLFEVEDLGPCPLRGFAQTDAGVPGPGAGARRGALRGPARRGAVTPLVGREQELASAPRSLAAGQGGRRPGRAPVRASPASASRASSSPCASGSATSRARSCAITARPTTPTPRFWPVIDQLERAAGILPHDLPEAKLDKLEALLGQAVCDPGEAAPLLAALLGIPSQGRYPSAELDPQQRKARTFDALLAQLEGLARQQPVLIVLEDAQWIDATTTELFDLAIDRLQRLPVLLVVTFRPEFQPPWTTHAHATLLTLNRLGVRQATAIVDRVAGGKALPAEVLDQILAKTDGVPLFVEELTKAVLELGLMREEGGRYVLAGPLPAMAIPSTLHGSLLARLDRLGAR